MLVRAVQQLRLAVARPELVRFFFLESVVAEAPAGGVRFAVESIALAGRRRLRLFRLRILLRSSCTTTFDFL